MLLALLLLACSGTVDPVDSSVVDTSDTGEPIGCCVVECQAGGSGFTLEGPDITLAMCEADAAGNCTEYTISEC